MFEGLFAAIGGIQCDNTACNFTDMSVKVQDYDKWLNKPCPKCSSNLLTQSDYDKVQQMLKNAKLVDRESKEIKEAEGQVSFSLNGTETVGVEVIDKTGEKPITVVKTNLNSEQFTTVLNEMNK